MNEGNNNLAGESIIPRRRVREPRRELGPLTRTGGIVPHLALSRVFWQAFGCWSGHFYG